LESALSSANSHGISYVIVDSGITGVVGKRTRAADLCRGRGRASDAEERENPGCRF
jgi:hypothetical protein